HMTKGGSHDVAKTIVKRVFKEKPPFKFTHEFLLIGGAKMSSSKGNAISAVDLVSIVPPELARFLLARVPYRKAINFDPSLNNTIPDLFDEYDKTGREWYKNGLKSDLGIIFLYSQINELSKKLLFTPRFRQVAGLMQMPSIDLVEYFSSEKKSSLTKEEKEILKERVKYAKIWLENYADEKEKFEIKKELPEGAKGLSDSQKKFLHSVADLIEKQSFDNGEKLQFEVFELVKTMKLASSEAFQALYIVLMDKKHGPKMGWVLLDLIQSKQVFLLKRLRAV
ncbi:class I tRNA ligase family protein, partial [Patescibacteria group bacterium]|nr:class I tRNA ligase family protein [Patescibacteria group bacterium]